MVGDRTPVTRFAFIFNELSVGDRSVGYLRKLHGSDQISFEKYSFRL